MLSLYAASAQVEDAAGMGVEERGKDRAEAGGGSDAYHDEEEDRDMLAAEPAAVGEACPVDVH